MNFLEKMREGIRKRMMNWLQPQPGIHAIQIQEMMDFELSAIRNRIWYRGDGNELEQLYQQSAESADRHKFWASRCSPGMEMRKIHTGLPGLMIKTINGIIVAAMGEFEFGEGNDVQSDVWKEIAKKNKFRKKFEKSLKEVLYIGDGAYKITIDTDISQYPILEWYPGERVEFVYERGQLKEIAFKTPYKKGFTQYTLVEYYGYGYVNSVLYKGETEVPLNSIKATEKLLPEVTFDKSVILGVPLMIYENTKFEGRGGSIFDGKLDSFDAYDEAWSQWMDALRAGRAKTYIPENIIPRNPETGELLKPNPFDNRFIATGSDMGENARNEVKVEQPVIPHDSYLASYVTALDQCLQGIISPSTLGIDVKKLDNAEAQREKEKATLYTRDAIIEALQETLPELASACINAYHILHKEPVAELEPSIDFGEYSNPSFESQVETLSKARPGSPIMSIEAQVEEMWGDNKDEDWKKQEVARLKAEAGIVEMEEPGVNTSLGEFNIQGGDGNAGEGGEEDVSNEPEGVQGTP
ncbi:hypothetical protein M2454_002927 [Aequitasia blattaphilus]|uniref:Phage portal protein n=1 Tax=Aequitasia blattaphilus TaxID=2949332 RepID=A0ABT1ECS9_9FIRM|nr:phage portal protein [Aequitasia blattaphilus]MCP1103608.1 phage portal protein [Aequitasia blattaphilus]MCR8616248.1 phage portal protein [Aequitasia blattaphilus]